jgi:hypothetical protein
MVLILLPFTADDIASDDDDDDKAWLTELTTAHRTTAASSDAVASTGPVIHAVATTASHEGEETSDEEAWLKELTTAHRPAVASTDVAASTGPVIHAVAATVPVVDLTRIPDVAATTALVVVSSSTRSSRPVGLAVALTGIAFASTGPVVAPTGYAVASAAPVVASTALKRRGVVVLGHRSRTWEEFVLFCQAVGPLPSPIYVPDRHCVIWQLPYDASEYSEFAYACRRLATWYRALGPIIFKVGIAADPEHRFWNREFGYDTEQEWLFMEVQARGPANHMRKLEISIIAGVGGLQGCRNQSAGGEGVRPDRVHTCFQYMVVAPAGAGIGLQRAWALVRNAFPVPGGASGGTGSCPGE